MAKERAKDVSKGGKVSPIEVLGFLMEQNVSKNHALGMIANMNTESGFNPLIEEKPGTGKGGIGLFQHTGPRRTALMKATGGDLTDWKAQISYTLSEQSSKDYLAKKFDTPEAATKDFMVNWEAPHDVSPTAIAGRQAWLKDYGNHTFATPGYTPESTSTYITPLNPDSISTPEHLRIAKLEEDVAAQKSDFNRRLEEEKQKEELAQKSKNIQELTKAEKDHNNRVAFLEAYSAPIPTDNTPHDPNIENIPSAMEQGLYTQNLGFDVQQGNNLFSTGQNPQMGDGGPVNNSIVSNTETPVDTDAMNAMMKARMAISSEFGNPAAQRMTSLNPKTGMTPEGTGTHYMTSMDEYAVPLLQDKGGNELIFNENPPPSSEDMKFRTPEEAKYFAEHYKEVAPMMRTFATGGTLSSLLDPNKIQEFRQRYSQQGE